jgi:hypothetical protein
MSGPRAILLIIVVLLVAALPLALIVGAATGRRKALVYTGPPPTSEELAYLHLGRGLAVQSALACLHVAATMHDRPMAGIRGTTPLQRAVNDKVAQGRRGRALVASPLVAAALDEIQRSLYLKGLLSGLDRRTPLGQALLHQQQRQHYYLAPSLRPAWRTYGPAAAGLGVALHGPATLTAISPHLSSELLWPIRTNRRWGSRPSNSSSRGSP